MHLTNYSLNKGNYKSELNKTIKDDEGTKRSISTGLKQLKNVNIKPNEFWEKVEEIVGKTIRVLRAELQKNYDLIFKKSQSNCCFQLIGLDLLMTENLELYLLELNHNPSFNEELSVDKYVKSGVILSTFKILNLVQNKSSLDYINYSKLSCNLDTQKNEFKYYQKDEY